MKIDDRIVAYRLEVDPRYWGIPRKVREAVDNGIGPESRPLFRRIATIALHRWRPGTRIHDVDFTLLNDGTREGFRKSNQRLRTNGRRIILAEVAWWRIAERAYLLWLNQRVFWTVSGDEGWKAWLAAYEAKQSEGPEVSA